jgi:hypothetical protein
MVIFAHLRFCRSPEGFHPAFTLHTLWVGRGRSRPELRS